MAHALSPHPLGFPTTLSIYLEEEGEEDGRALGEGLRADLVRECLDLRVLGRLRGDDEIDVGRVRDGVLQDGVDGHAVPLRDLAYRDVEGVVVRKSACPNKGDRMESDRQANSRTRINRQIIYLKKKKGKAHRRRG